MEWGEIWGSLGSEKNWEVEKYRTLLGAQDFHRHWDRYGPSSYSFLNTSTDSPKLQSVCTTQALGTNFEGRFG